MAKGRKPNASDAEICMKLYELRREAELRKARNFVNFQFQPQSVDDVMKIAQAIGTQENAWMRQVFSFWEYAASLVNQGVVQRDLFFTWNGEMAFVYAKFKPYLEEGRKRMNNPNFMAGVEKAVNSSPEIKKHVEMIRQRFFSQAKGAAAN